MGNRTRRHRGLGDSAVKRCRAKRCTNELRSFAWYGLCGYHLIEIYQTIQRVGGPRSLPEWDLYVVPELRERKERLERETGRPFYEPELDGPPPEPEPEPKAAPVKGGTIYYLKVGEHIKIGWTSDMSKRMRFYPPNSILLATEPGTRADENRRHKMLAAHRSHGNEWYVPAPSVLHHIDMVKGKHGEPDPAAFAAQPVQIPQPREPHYIGGKNRGDWQRGEIRG